MQVLLSAFISKQEINEKYFYADSRANKILNMVSVGRTTIVSIIMLLISLVILIGVLLNWSGNDFLVLDNNHMTWGILGLVLFILAIMILSSGFIIFLIKNKKNNF
jgi:hypothetical protein